MNQMLIKKKRIPVKDLVLYGLWPSFIKKVLYHLKGYKIGKNVKIGFGSIIVGKNIRIGENSKIGAFTFIISNEINIGKFVQINSFTYLDVRKFYINDDSRINEHVYVSGLSLPESELRMGKRTLIMQYSFLNPTKPIILEDDVALGGLCCIFTHSSWQSVMDGYPVRFEPVTIRKNVWIAWRVFILPGVEIGENSTIAADSTVTMNIPPHSLASGSPAKVNLSGEKFWPRKISDKAKQKLLKDINQEFVAYLQDNGFKSEYVFEGDKQSISLKQLPGKIFFNISTDSNLKLNKNDTLVSLFNDIQHKDESMKLNISQKWRTGSNRLGEEYVRFLSRYGIRFDRRD